ncbi:hypothetical protein ACS0TY_036113 [Phlomoides rotata]
MVLHSGSAPLATGKTKVFLRAGQMADLDAWRVLILSNATKKIQRKIRTHIAQRHYLALQQAAICETLEARDESFLIRNFRQWRFLMFGLKNCHSNRFFWRFAELVWRARLLCGHELDFMMCGGFLSFTAGFPADSLTDEEIEYGVVSVVGGIEQVNYILIRNHIITKWRENVSTWITKEMFVDIVPKHCSTLLDTTYRYLVSRGYINFGVAPEIKERIMVEPK